MVALRAHFFGAGDIIESAFVYWREIKGARTMPARTDIDPTVIPRLLPFIMLFDVLDNPLDFRCRLVGTEIERIARANPRGRRLSESRSHRRGSRAWEAYAHVVTLGEPQTAPLDYDGPDRFVIGVRLGLMPLSSDGKTVDMIFSVTEIQRR
jgi:hypothetical protein